MEHILFKQKVKSEKIKEYINAHKNAPQELLNAMKNSGLNNMIIWIDGCELYLYAIADNFDGAYAKLVMTEVFQKWLTIMTPLLDEVQDYSEEGKIQKLNKIFDIEAQLKD